MDLVKLELTVYESLALLVVLEEIPKVNVENILKILDDLKESINRQLEEIESLD